jgi:energy-coupling factor transport system ATP-binding protein
VVEQIATARPRAAARRRGRLSAEELAEAVVLGDLTLALCLVGHLVPLASVLFAAAVVPMAAVAARHRVRAVVAGGIAASVVAFLVAGAGLVTSVASCAVLGAVVGSATRRSWGVGRTVLVGIVVLWPPAASAAVGALFLLADLRRLTLAQITNSWRGISQTLRDLGANGAARIGDDVIRWATRDWWLSIPIALLGALAGSVALAWLIARPTLGRVRAAMKGDGPLAPADDGSPVPVPVELRDVAFRYDPGGPLALDGLSLEIRPAEFVAVVGPNGSGKSTLARVLVGRPPSAGTVARAGAVGLGHRYGTSIVFQRPEAQVLGVRVRDDIVWGLGADTTVDIDAVLERVGLSGMADRETSTLSGGELQRLAVGAALAREPQLLVSDESTAMVDPAGRERLVALLRETSTERGVAVVHVTHRQVECRVADRVIALDAGRMVAPRRGSRRGHRGRMPCSGCTTSATSTRRGPRGLPGRSSTSTWSSRPGRACSCSATTAPASRPWRGSWRGCSSRPKGPRRWTASPSAGRPDGSGWRFSTPGSSCSAPPWGATSRPRRARVPRRSRPRWTRSGSTRTCSRPAASTS